MGYLLIAVIIAVGIFLIARAYREHQISDRLRRNPADKAVIEVRLPRDITDANERMQRFYQKVGSHVANDEKMRAEGQGTLDVVYFVEVPRGKSAPELRFLVYAPPEKMSAIKRTLQQAFKGHAEVTVPTSDPMAGLAAALRPAEYEPDEDARA